MKYFLCFALCMFILPAQATNWLDLGADTDPALDDEVLSLDVSDSSMHASGTVKRVLRKDLLKNTSVSITAADSPYTVTTDVKVIFANATSGAIIINAYSPVGNLDRTIQVHKEDGTANDVTLTGTGPELPVVLNLHGTFSVQSDNVIWHVMQKTPISAPSLENEALATAASGVYYAFGFYNWSATDANLTQAVQTAVIGTANISHGAHAGIVAAAAGAAAGGAGAVEIEVSGTSISDAGVETTSDTEILVADITTLATDAHHETDKKWTGVITYTLQNASGSTQTTFAVDANYGLSAYDDRANRDFTVSTLTVLVTGGASDTGFDVELLHHKDTGWTYAATGFVAGNGAVAQFTTDSPTNNNLASDEQMRWKRSNLSTGMSGSTNEGYICRVTTTANNAIRIANIAVGVEF